MFHIFFNPLTRKVNCLVHAIHHELGHILDPLHIRLHLCVYFIFKDPFVALLSTFPNTSMLRTSLNRGIASKALASSPHPFPIKVSDESGSISLEQKKKAKQRVRDLQTREQDLRRLKSKVQCIWDRFCEKGSIMHVFQDFKSF